MSIDRTAVGYSKAKAARDAIEANVSRLNVALQSFPRNSIGLTPDAVKASPGYVAAKAAYDSAFNQLRAFNTNFVKAFAKEIRMERHSRRQMVGD